MILVVSWCVLRDWRCCMVQCDNKGSFVNPERWVRSPLCSPQEMKRHWISMSRLFSESSSQSYLVCLSDSEILLPTKHILTSISALETLTLKRMWISLGTISYVSFFKVRFCDWPLLLEEISVFLRESNHRGLSFLTCNVL